MNPDKAFYYVFIFFLILFLGTAIVLIILANHGVSYNLPEDVDLVIQDRGRGRTEAQINAVKRHMNWVRRIYVINTTRSGQVAGDKVFYVQSTETDPLQVYTQMPTIISDLADHALFFDDRVFPLRSIRKRYFWYKGDHPRAFNLMPDSTIRQFFMMYEEDPITDFASDTLPVFVGEMESLKQLGNLKQWVFSEVTSERISLRNDFSRKVFVNAEMLANSDKQLQGLLDSTPLFVTFSVSGTDQTAKDTANDHLVAWLNTKLP